MAAAAAGRRADGGGGHSGGGTGGRMADVVKEAADRDVARAAVVMPATTSVAMLAAAREVGTATAME